MFGLQRGRRAGKRGMALGLLAEIAPDRRPGRADRLTQSYRDDMAVADFDRDGVGLDDEVLRLVLLGARKRGGGRSRVRPHRGAIEILAPILIGGLENDNAIREAAGGDDIGHADLAGGERSRRRGPIADYTANIYD